MVLRVTHTIIGHRASSIERQAAQLKKGDEIISRLEAENALLRQKVDLLVRKVFGPSSDKLDPALLGSVDLGQRGALIILRLHRC